MSASIPSGPVEAAIREAVTGGLPATIADLSRLVRIPSVSWDGFDPARVQESAEAVAELLRGLDVFETVSIERADRADGSPGHPAVLARRAARDGAPTVLLYAHHDVQPPGADEDWETPPFEPVLRPTPQGDRLFGRGTADDKAGVLVHVAAIRALVEALGQLDLGLAVFVEGEEEFGSPSFKDFIVRHRDALAADAIVVADSGNWDVETPAITVGLRGNVAFNLTVRTLEHASHSGMFGGVVPDAMMAATRLLASLWDDDGAVAVEGLRRRAAEVPAYAEARIRAEAGVPDGVALIGDGPVLDRNWNQPAITVTGMDLPSVQHASNTLIPAVRVRVSARVAPGQSAAEAYAALRAHIAAHTPYGAEVAYDEKVDLGDPFLVDTGAGLFRLAKDALTAGWGRETVEIGIGGSIPFIADLVEVFPDAQILVTGVEDADTRAHSPNESLHLGVLRRAIVSEALLLAALNGRG
ncbi:MAG: dipeptidase [Micrococcales bacterium 73-13]|nr:MAG: dipeptidase [Micrococcales bacterium 73-13]